MIEELFYHRSIPMTATLAATVRSNGRLLSSMPAMLVRQMRCRGDLFALRDVPQCFGRVAESRMQGIEV